ncbi:MAG: superinfection immunity protein [Acidimicrobiales bacterium]
MLADIVGPDIFVAGFLLMVLYLVPSLLGAVLRRKNLRSIVRTNVFLGWTVVGWFVALIMVWIPEGRAVDCSGMGG